MCVPCLPGASALIPLGHVTVDAPKHLAVWSTGRKGSWMGECSGVLFSFSKNQPQNHSRQNLETWVLVLALISGKPLPSPSLGLRFPIYKISRLDFLMPKVPSGATF